MESIGQAIERHLLTCERCNNRFLTHTGKTHVGKPGDILCSAECYKQKYPTEHLRVMITGSRNLSKGRLPVGVSVDNMIRDQIRLFFESLKKYKGISVHIGDAGGVDKIAQEYLSEHIKESKQWIQTTVCYLKDRKPRTKPRKEFSYFSGWLGDEFTSYLDRDDYMISVSDFMLVIRCNRSDSTGTTRNLTKAGGIKMPYLLVDL